MNEPTSPAAPITSTATRGPRAQLRRAFAALGLNLRRAGAALSNARRRLVRRRLPDYVTLTLSAPLRELAAETPWYVRWFAPAGVPASLQSLAPRLRRVAEDPDVRGLLLIVRSAPLSRSGAQSLALLLARFRDWDRAANPTVRPNALSSGWSRSARRTPQPLPPPMRSTLRRRARGR